MDGFERYKKRVFLDGATSQERIINQKKKDVDKYIKKAPNKFEINIDNKIEKYLITLQDVALNNKSGDEKYVVTYNETPMKIGSMFECLNNTWIVIEKENNSMQDHQTFKVRPCNDFLKFKSNNQIISLPIILENKTLWNPGINENKVMTTGDTLKNVIVPLNEHTKKFKRGMRFIFKIVSELIAYEITAMDDSREGIIGLTLQETEIMDIERKTGIGFNEQVIIPIGNYILTGDVKIPYGKSKIYRIKHEDNTDVTDKVFTFTIDNIELATITSNTDSTVTILANNKSKKGIIKLTATCGDVVLTKDIKIESLM